jgi:hypothetical protein
MVLGYKALQPLSINLIRFEFANDAEEVASRQLSDLQKRHIENLIADCIDEKIKLVPSLETPNDFFFKSEYLRGQIEVLHYLLALSDIKEVNHNSID